MGKRPFISSNQTRGYRQIGTYQVTQDNQQILVDLPRGPHIESAIIRVAGSANITVAGTAVRNNAAALFLRRVDWVLNSNVTLDSVSGSQADQLMRMTRRQVPTNTNPAAATVSVQPFVATWILDRALMDMVRPKDSMLKTDVGVSNCQLRIQMGALSDMFTGTPTIGYTAVNVTVWVADYQEMRDAEGRTPSPDWYVKRNGLVQAFSAAGNGQQVKLSTGNRLRAVSMRVLNATTREPDITLLSRLRLQRAGDTRVDMLVADLVQQNAAQFAVVMATGQVVIDLAAPGYLSGVRYSEFWPIPSSADTFLLCDTTAAAQLDIATLEGVDIVNG